jgi:hypothetical protein
LKEEIRKRVSWLIQNPRSSINKVDFNLKLYINDIPLLDNPLVLRRTAIIGGQDTYLRLRIHNQTNQVYDMSNWDFGLLTPTFISQVRDQVRGAYFHRIDLEDGKLFSFQKIEYRLLPDGWLQYDILITSETNFPFETHNFVLKIFSEIGPKEYPFRVIVGW